VERVREGIAGLSPGDDLAPGWSGNLAIEVDGTIVGDIYVGIHETGGAAEIGFTLATEHQGRGYASEAAAAIVEALFDRVGVHRVHAELDPANLASQRTLERLGLSFEYSTTGSYFGRGRWGDSMGYGASKAQFDEWRHRPRHTPSEVRLVELDAGNHRPYLALRTHHSEERFVSPNPVSIVDAFFPEVVDGAPVVPWLRGVDADGTPVGFVMVAEVTDHHPEPYLWRLMVDRRHQRRGIARAVLSTLVERLRAEGATTLLTSWVEGPGSPRPFYERFGFVPTGRIVDGETEARLEL
jgi:RimJ/RimL family protein N-acetyltransferase